MPASLVSTAELALTAALATWMAFGFTKRPGRWFRWKLFANATFTVVTLTGTKDGRTELVNPYAELSPGSLLLPPPVLQTIISHYVRTGRYDQIDGHGRVLSAQGEQRIEVRDSRVVL
ncbi:hypothetical protein ACFVRD_38020 [Streptomyces sp. NPDC057908]|uniref:hypothetical protein n=1 Tax=Streptomyces sp. NPDC057908 TaxID=3346276 RepID=UPI0036E22CC9